MHKSEPIAEEIVSESEADALFLGLENLSGLMLAVSGGPDSTALLVFAAHWAKSLPRAPKLLAVTVDHGLRAEAAAEAAAVQRLARRLKIPHRTLHWRGEKPGTGVQEAAREARYALLAELAARDGCTHIVTAHTLDDQAETVLFRMARGSGVSGLTGMARAASVPVRRWRDVHVLRPLLHLPKTRLIATLQALRIDYSEDPSNRDTGFARPRLRALMPQLAREGLDAHGLARLAWRLRRVEAAIVMAVDAARAALAPQPWPPEGPITFETSLFAALPAEVALRLLGEAIARVGNEGPVELRKLEALCEALAQARSRLRRTLAGALVTLESNRLIIETAPARRTLAMRRGGNRRFTK